MPSKIFKKWSTLLGSTLIHFTYNVFSFGNFSPYLTSYLREIAGSDVRYSNSNWIQTSGLIAMSFTMVFNGLFISKFRPKLILVLFTGLFIHSSAYALSFFTVKISFELTLITYGILTGIGFGMAYLIPMEMCMRWFPESRGLATSVIWLGTSASGVIFNQVQTSYINPKNLSPDKPYSNEYPNEKYFSDRDLLNKVPKLFLLMSGISLCIQIVGCILIFENEEQNKDYMANQHINDDEEDNLNEKKELVTKKKINSLGLNYGDTNEGFTLKEVFRMPMFYIIMIIHSNSTQAAMFVTTFYKDFGQTFIKDDQYFALILSVSSIVSGIGRLFIGRIIDKISFKLCYLTICSVEIALCCTIYFNEYIVNKAVYLIWNCAINLLMGVFFILTPTLVVKTFGQKHFTSIYGMLMLVNFPFTLISTYASVSIDYFGYFWYFFIGSCLTLTGYISALFFNVKNEDGNDI